MLTIYSRASNNQQKLLLERSESVNSLNITPDTNMERSRSRYHFQKLYDSIENVRVLKKEYGICIPEESIRNSSLAERLEAISCMRDKDATSSV